MTKKPLVYIVTPTFNGKEYVLQFLDSLSRQTYKNFKTIIVDDGSTDGTSAEIAKQYPETIVLRGDGTLFWTGATNEGVRRALKDKADYIITVNNDVEVEKDWVEKLVEASMKSPGCLVGSTIYYANDRKKVWFYGAEYEYKTGKLVHREKITKDLADSIWLTGMGVIIPAEVFKKIGLYDRKAFPQYFADADFSLRAKEARFGLKVTKHAKLYNYVESAWDNKQMQSKQVGVISRMLFKFNSPHNIRARYIFYKRHFKGFYPKYFIRYYAHFTRHLALPYVRSIYFPKKAKK